MALPGLERSTVPRKHLACDTLTSITPAPKRQKNYWNTYIVNTAEIIVPPTRNFQGQRGTFWRLRPNVMRWGITGRFYGSRGTNGTSCGHQHFRLCNIRCAMKILKRTLRGTSLSPGGVSANAPPR